MTVTDPLWLLLALPLIAGMLRFPLASRLMNALRLAIVLLLVAAIAGLSIRLPSRAGTVVVIADRSRSMPADSDASHQELLDLLQAGMPGENRLAVVAFGQTAVVERAGETGRFAGFHHEIGADGSSLADAVETGLALIPKDSPGRLFIVSDGTWTGRDPATLAGVAADRGIAIDYRHKSRAAAGDVAIVLVDAPVSVAPCEGFLITAWVQSATDREATFEVTRGTTVIASGTKKLSAGLNRLTFRDRATVPGSQGYRINIGVGNDDPVPENNTARALVGVSGPRPILHLSPGNSSGLAALLQAGGLDLRAMPPERFNFSLESLSGHSAVVLENVPAEKIGTRGMETLAGWVRASGSGLMITGGKQSYGPGGYYKSPLEPIMPVSMELRQDHRKLALAIVVALDRSGSMALPVSGGHVKMDLANLGAAQVLDMLSPIDEFACFAVDTAPHVVTELGTVTDKEAVRDRILRIRSEGGGIYVDEALMASADTILRAKAGTKHIILFADAADAEQPGKYKDLLDRTRKAGITVSVIGLGKPTDKDAALLEDVAKRGGGRFFITDRPEELPRLFAQDTFVVSRNAFLEDPVRMVRPPWLKPLAGLLCELYRAIGPSNPASFRPEDTLAAFTKDEYSAPVVANWQAGAGRVLCYTGEADGKYAGGFAKSPETGEFYTSLARWTAGQHGSLAEGMAVTQEVRNGVNRVRLHLDPDRKSDPFSGTPQMQSLRARSGEGPRIETIPLAWSGPDTLVAEVPLEGDETALSTVSIAGQKPQPLAPVCLPYSPEYAPVSPGDGDRGRIALEKFARATGGSERIELAGIWMDLPKRPRSFPLAPYLLIAAIVFLLLEVLERRTGLVSHIATNLPRVVKTLFRFRRKRAVVAVPKAAPNASPEPIAVPPSPAPPPPPAPASESILDAMQKARERSRGRTES